jgi:hypothetical protein
MNLRRGQKIAKEVLDFNVINRKKEAIDRFKQGDVVIPVGSDNIFDYGIVDNVDENIYKIMVNYDGNIKQHDPDEIRLHLSSDLFKQARRVKSSL